MLVVYRMVRVQRGAVGAHDLAISSKTMAAFFPTATGSWKLEEPAAFRRLSMSIIEMAVMTGVVMRLYNAVALTNGPTGSWLYIATIVALGIILLLGMATLHIGNYTLKQWLWRAPAFAALEAAAESLTSLFLIALHREPLGAGRAQYADWWGIAGSLLFWRVVGVSLFALLLAGVVQLVRRWLVKKDHREHTLETVHHEFEEINRQRNGPKDAP